MIDSHAVLDGHRPLPGRFGVHGSGRGRVLRFVLASVLAGLVAIGVTGWAVDRQYRSPEPGSFGGIVSTGAFSAGAFSAADGFSPYRLTAAGGRLMQSLSNPGSRPITVSSVTAGSEVSEIQWSRYVLVSGGDLSGTDTPWQGFPAVIPAHGTIRLLLTVHRPARCPDAAAQDSLPVDYRVLLNVHWRSLLSSHTSTVTPVAGADDLRLC